MSPLAAWVADESAPLVLAAALLVEWWAVWFTLGRNFTVTLQLTLAANAASLGLAWAARLSGALGEPGTDAAAPWPAWVAAWLLLLMSNVAVESAVLRAAMRQRRPGWQWNRYDLAVCAAANALSLSLAALHRLLA